MMTRESEESKSGLSFVFVLFSSPKVADVISLGTRVFFLHDSSPSVTLLFYFYIFNHFLMNIWLLTFLFFI